jgi:hypothetical protein
MRGNVEMREEEDDMEGFEEVKKGSAYALEVDGIRRKM